MSEERDQTLWTQTLKATPAAYEVPGPAQERTMPTSIAAPRPVVPDLDEETQLSDGPPVLPHTELTQPSHWQHEPTQTLGPIASEQDPAFHRDETVARASSAISTDPTVLLAPAKPKRKRRSSRRRDALTMTAAKSGIAGLAVAIVLSASVFILALFTL